MGLALDALSKVLAIGNKLAGNYFEIGLTGTPRLRGSATVYKDMVGDLFGKRLATTTGRVDYDFDENAIKFQNNGSISTPNDRVGANLQINHEFQVGSGVTFKPHFHWWQNDTVKRVVTMQYRILRNGQPRPLAWTKVTATCADGDDTFTYAGETNFDQITHFPDIVTDCGISDTIQFQMARTDSLSGDLYVYFMDMHGAVDSEGSDDWMGKEV